MSPQIVQLGEFEEERSTGEKIKFVVQTAPLEMTEEIVEHMTSFFLPREPMSMTLLIGDPVSTRSMQQLWRGGIAEGTSLIALEIVDGQSPKLIGANVTPISHKQSKESVFEGEGFNMVLDALIDVSSRSGIFEKYGVDRYMTGYGLSVDPKYHGYRVGQRLLEARRPLCKHLGIKATGTVFTATSSQHIADKVGFELLSELEYSTYTIKGKKPFSNIPGKMFMMGIKF